MFLCFFSSSLINKNGGSCKNVEYGNGGYIY